MSYTRILLGPPMMWLLIKGKFVYVLIGPLNVTMVTHQTLVHYSVCFLNSYSCIPLVAPLINYIGEHAPLL